MSMVTCERCDCAIDSDDDPGCFIENPYNSRDTRILCENCRECEWDRYQESLTEGGGGPSLREQQIEAMKLK